MLSSLPTRSILIADAGMGTETMQSIDSEWERVTIEEDASGKPKRFGRVMVSSQ